MMPARIVMKDGAFNYGPRNIFTGIDLSLDKGETLCLLGPNGCGKTTLLACLGGLMPLKSGSISLGDKEISTLTDRQRARIVGFVFQEHHVLFPYTVRDVVLMGRAPHLGLFSSPSAADREIADRAIELVGMESLGEARHTEISGGERQLVLIARAVAQEPEVLLLDEPTSHLDFGNQTRILRTIRQLTEKTGLAVMMATHYPDHALSVADRVVLMKDGGVLTEGSPDSTITESNLKTLYGIDVRMVSTNGDGREPVRAAIPLMTIR
jgi:iron complex transport system ATP-binding protein